MNTCSWAKRIETLLICAYSGSRSFRKSLIEFAMAVATKKRIRDIPQPIGRNRNKWPLRGINVHLTMSGVGLTLTDLNVWSPTQSVKVCAFQGHSRNARKGRERTSPPAASMRVLAPVVWFVVFRGKRLLLVHPIAHYAVKSARVGNPYFVVFSPQDCRSSGAASRAENLLQRMNITMSSRASSKAHAKASSMAPS